MNKLIPVLLCLILSSGIVSAEPVLDEKTVKGISAEFRQALTNADISVFQKYLYPGSKIIIDVDPSVSAGQVEVPYSDYMELLEMSLALMQGASISEELISISVDADKNQATIREKNTVVMEVMGVKVRDVSISETTYGVVNGQIKALIATDELVSSEPIG